MNTELAAFVFLYPLFWVIVAYTGLWWVRRQNRLADTLAMLEQRSRP